MQAEDIINLIKVILIVVTIIIGIYEFKREQWGKIISQSRINWINEFRNDIATLVSFKKLNVNEKSKWYLAKYRLLQKINITNQNEQTYLNEELYELVSNYELESSNSALDDRILEISRQLLEIEWQRVKKEARGIRK